jgi:RNA-directed DNA polymerase
MAHHRTSKLETGENALERLNSKIRELSRQGRGRNLKRVIEELTPILRGWSNYFKLWAAIESRFAQCQLELHPLP